MTPDAVLEAAALLAHCRYQQHSIRALPTELTPMSLTDAYAVQDELLAMLGYDLVGWKVGATTVSARELLGVTEPIAGRLVDWSVQTTGADVSTAGFLHPPGVAVSFGLELRRDLPEAPARGEDLADAVRLVPVLELWDTRYQSWEAVSAAALVADNAMTGQAVRGPTATAPAALMAALDTADAVLSVDDEIAAIGMGWEQHGHPLEVLRWLAGFAAGRGTPLRAKELVLTGAASPLIYGRAGQHLTGVVAGLTVTATLVD